MSKLSESIRIRPATLADAETIARVHIQAWQESYRHIFAHEYLESLSYSDRLEFRKRMLAEPSPKELHLVVVDGDHIIGFCDAGPRHSVESTEPGEVYAIYLLESHKNQGIGTKLIQMAHEFLADRGFTPYVVWVLEENTSACRFYESRGGKSTHIRYDCRGQKAKVLGYVFY